MVYGLWFMVYGLWFMVYGLWFMVSKFQSFKVSKFKVQSFNRALSERREPLGAR